MPLVLIWYYRLILVLGTTIFLLYVVSAVRGLLQDQRTKSEQKAITRLTHGLQNSALDSKITGSQDTIGTTTVQDAFRVQIHQTDSSKKTILDTVAADWHLSGIAKYRRNRHLPTAACDNEHQGKGAQAMLRDLDIGQILQKWPRIRLHSLRIR